MAVGVIIGGAFGKIVSPCKRHILAPLIGLITGGTNERPVPAAWGAMSHMSIEAAKEAGVGTFNYGMFLQTS